MKSFTTINRVLWALALSAVLSTVGAFAQRPKQDPPKSPPQRTERNSDHSNRTSYVPRATNPTQRQNPQRSNDQRDNYIPRATNPTQRQNPPRINDPRENYIPRATNPTQRQNPPRNNDPRESYIPRANDPAQSRRGQNNAPRNSDAGARPRSGQTGPTGYIPRASYLAFSSGRPGQQPGDRNRGRDQGGSQGQRNQGRRDQSNSARSGHSDYHGSNNRYDHGISRPYWSPPPVMTVEQFRQHQIDQLRNAHTVYGDHARRGYYGYHQSWRDNDFAYPFYVFDPYQTFGFVSPWYFYPSLPGYISTNRCRVLDQSVLPPIFIGTPYTWYGAGDAYQRGYDQGYAAGRQAGSQSDNRILDGALDDIVAVFKADDQRSLDRLVGESGNVNIYVDGRYSYTLSDNDYYDLMRDNANTTETVDYQILGVRVDRDMAKVFALHTFKDPWGQVERVYHTYVLNLGRRSVEITDFGTSDTDPTQQ